jgi:hypothetical protein
VYLASEEGYKVDHLEPEDGYFAEYRGPDPYDIRVAELLLGEHHNRTCQTIFHPSFQAERAVYVTGAVGEENAVVVAKELRPALWSAMTDVLQRESTDGSYSHTSGSRRDALEKVTVTVIKGTATLDTSTVELLEAVWSMALMEVRYRIERADGFDGTVYHIASFIPGEGYRAGTTWSPPPGSKPRDLVELAEALETFARSSEAERSDARRHLVRLGKALHDRLRGFEGTLE